MKNFLLIIFCLVCVHVSAQIVQGIPNVQVFVNADSTGFVVTYDTTGSQPYFCYPLLEDKDVINQGIYNAAAWSVFETKNGELHAYIDRNQLSGFYCYVYEINPYLTTHHYTVWVHSWVDGSLHYQDITVTLFPPLPRGKLHHPNNGHHH